jgi:4-carboxymuconolactone decarboxylase
MMHPSVFILLIITGAAVIGMAAGGGELAAQPERIRISKAAEREARPAPVEYFTGQVMVEMLFGAEAPARASCGRVTFQPGARTAWHTHPLGQTLIVTDGVGRVQEWGGPVREIRAGDVVRIAPGVKHWHGAAPDSAMTHLAIQEALDGRTVDWMEKVSDEQYGK